MIARRGIVRTCIGLGETHEAQRAVDAVLTEMGDDDMVADEIVWAADGFREGGMPDEALGWYQYILERWPRTAVAMWAHTGIAKTDVASDKDDAVAGRVDLLVSEFGGQPELIRSLLQIGEAYYTRAFVLDSGGLGAGPEGKFRKAAAVWQRIIRELPVDTRYTPYAHYLAGRAFQSVGEYESAVGYFDTVIANWSEFDKIWDVYLQKARCCEQLVWSKQIPPEDGAVQIRQACQQIVADYPDCPIVNTANAMLQHWEEKKPGSGEQK